MAPKRGEETAVADPPSAPPEEPAAKGEAEAGQEPPSSKSDAPARSAGPAAAPEQEAPSSKPAEEEKPEAQPKGRDELEAARQAQAEADRRYHDERKERERLQREINQRRIQELQAGRQQRLAERRKLYEEDPDEFGRRVLAEEERAYENADTFRNFREATVREGREWASTLGFNISAEEMDDAESRLAAQTRQEQNRDPLASEVFAAWHVVEVGKLQEQMEAKDAELGELREQVDSLKKQITGEIVENGDNSPDTPAGGRPPNGRLTYESYMAMTANERAKVPVDEESRMIREEMRRRSGVR